MKHVISYALFTIFAIGTTGCGRQEITPGPCDCDPAIDFPADLSLSAELDSLRNEAASVFGLNTDEIVKIGSERNFVGLATPTTRFSRRIDSLTYLIQDEEFGLGRPKGVFNGPDSDLIKAGREILTRIGLADAQIDEEIVLTEMTQVGQRAGERLKMEPPVQASKSLRITRRIVGLPVFSSKVALSLNAKKGIGHLELHWPDIPQWVLVEAKRMDVLVKSGWAPPQRKGATPENVQAGIVHSSAIGFVMDIYPAIRVVYSSQDEYLGRKLMEYYDRHGDLIATPRVFAKQDELLMREWAKERK